MGKLHLKKLNINALRNNVAGNHSIYLSVVLFIGKKDFIIHPLCR